MSFGSSATSISQSKRNDDLCSVILHTMVPQPEFVATNLDRDGATFPLNPALGLTQLGHLLGLVRSERALGPRVPLHHGGSQVVYMPSSARSLRLGKQLKHAQPTLPSQHTVI